MMHVACAADAAYLPHCAAMLHSLLTQQTMPVTVHFLHDTTLQADAGTQLGAYVIQLGGHWRAHCVDARQGARFPGNARFGRVAWYRVLLPELLPDQPRVLYLDADMIVLRRLDALWRTELQGHAVGAVANPLYPFLDDRFLSALGLHGTAEYFNSGMLLIDLEQWRRDDITARLVAFASTHARTQEWPDQNGLNAVLRGRWLPLPPQWNAQNTLFDLPPSLLPFSAEQIAQARTEPAVLHFIGPYKPWHYRCKHKHRALYLQHRSATPWPLAQLDGQTPANRLLRLLPEQVGWRLEARMRAWRRGRKARASA